MECIDSIIKEQIKKAQEELPKELDQKIELLLENLPESKMPKKKKYNKAILIAATLLITSSTVIATTVPAARQTIEAVISYFSTSKNLTYTSDKKLIAQYARGIKLSTAHEGIEFTVEEIVMDESYLYIFYNVQSEEMIDYPLGQIIGDETGLVPCIDVLIDGKEAINETNNDYQESYLIDPYTLSGVKRMSLAKTPLEEVFELQIEMISALNQEGNWVVQSQIDKSAIKSESRSVSTNIAEVVTLQDGKHDITVDKVILSPLGSQIVISENIKAYNYFNTFILLDDKRQVLSLIPSGINVKEEGRITNTFEFIGANQDLAYLTLIPVQKLEEGLSSVPMLIDLNHLPATVPIGEHGKLIIHSVELMDQYIKVQYEKQGIMLDRAPLFEFYNSKIEEEATEIPIIDPARHPGGGQIESIDRTSGLYTRVLEIDTEDGGRKEDLKDIKAMIVYAAQAIELLEEQAITINLMEK